MEDADSEAVSVVGAQGSVASVSWVSGGKTLGRRPIAEMKQLRHREVKKLALCHTAREEPNWERINWHCLRKESQLITGT